MFRKLKLQLIDTKHAIHVIWLAIVRNSKIYFKRVWINAQAKQYKRKILRWEDWIQMYTFFNWLYIACTVLVVYCWCVFAAMVRVLVQAGFWFAVWWFHWHLVCLFGEGYYWLLNIKKMSVWSVSGTTHQRSLYFSF